jgi:hypothetical protein
MNPFAEPLYATLLVLVVTNSRVILAADSRRNVLYPDGAREQGTMDKIFQTGNCYYAVSGFSSTYDGRFSLQAVLHKLLLFYPDFNSGLTRIAKAVASELKNYLSVLNSTSPALFAQLRRDSNSGGEIVLVKRVGDVPTAALLTYHIIDGAPVKIVLQNWRIDTTSIKGEDDCFWRAIGNTGFLNGRLPSENEMATRPIEAVKRLMQEGIKANPQQIGGPINILEVTPTGEQWIEKSPTAPGHTPSS